MPFAPPSEVVIPSKTSELDFAALCDRVDILEKLPRGDTVATTTELDLLRNQHAELKGAMEKLTETVSAINLRGGIHCHNLSN